MRKLLALLLACIMLVSFSSCVTIENSDSDSDDNDKSTSTVKSDEDEDDTDTTDSAESESENEDTAEEPEEETEDTEEAEDETEPETESNIFEFGEASGRSYRNESIGLSCQIPSDWSFYDADQIASLNGMVADQLENVNISADSGSIFDMYAIHSSGNNVSVAVSKNDKYTEENLGLYLALSTPTMEENLEALGFEDLDSRNTTVTVDGRELEGCCISGSIRGISVYETMAVYMIDDYLVIITVTAVSEDVADEIFDCFEFI